MRPLPIIASFVFHAGALVAVGLTSRSGSESQHMPTFFSMQSIEPRASPEESEPLTVDLPDPPAAALTMVEPEPVAEEPLEPEPIDFGACDEPDAIPPSAPAPRAVRIAPLRHTSRTPAPEPARAPAPVPVRVRAPASVEAAPVVTAAVPRGGSCRPPRYPAAAQRLGHEGHVVLRVRVGVDGSPLSVEVEESSGHDMLDEAAVAAVRDWTFEPAREGGRVIESLLRVPFRFRLRP